MRCRRVERAGGERGQREQRGQLREPPPHRSIGRAPRAGTARARRAAMSAHGLADDAAEPSLRGELYKFGTLQWNKRYFVLDEAGSIIFYWSDAAKFAASDAPKGAIHLFTVDSVELVPGQPSRAPSGLAGALTLRLRDGHSDASTVTLAAETLTSSRGWRGSSWRTPRRCRRRSARSSASRRCGSRRRRRSARAGCGKSAACGTASIAVGLSSPSAASSATTRPLTPTRRPRSSTSALCAARPRGGVAVGRRGLQLRDRSARARQDVGARHRRSHRGRRLEGNITGGVRADRVPPPRRRRRRSSTHSGARSAPPRRRTRRRATRRRRRVRLGVERWRGLASRVGGRRCARAVVWTTSSEETQLAALPLAGSRVDLLSDTAESAAAAAADASSSTACASWAQCRRRCCSPCPPKQRATRGSHGCGSPSPPRRPRRRNRRRRPKPRPRRRSRRSLAPSTTSSWRARPPPSECSAAAGGGADAAPAEASGGAPAAEARGPAPLSAAEYHRLWCEEALVYALSDAVAAQMVRELYGCRLPSSKRSSSRRPPPTARRTC